MAGLLTSPFGVSEGLGVPQPPRPSQNSWPDRRYGGQLGRWPRQQGQPPFHSNYILLISLYSRSTTLTCRFVQSCLWGCFCWICLTLVIFLEEVAEWGNLHWGVPVNPNPMILSLECRIKLSKHQPWPKLSHWLRLFWSRLAWINIL